MCVCVCNPVVHGSLFPVFACLCAGVCVCNPVVQGSLFPVFACLCAGACSTIGILHAMKLLPMVGPQHHWHTARNEAIANGGSEISKKAPVPRLAFQAGFQGFLFQQAECMCNMSVTCSCSCTCVTCASSADMYSHAKLVRTCAVKSS